MNEQLREICKHLIYNMDLPSVIALALSVVALFQNKKQVHLNNKHQLFDRRLSAYVMFQDFAHSYSNIKKLNYPSENHLIVGWNKLILAMLCNNLSLESIVIPARHLTDIENYRDFNLKMAQLRQKIQEIPFLFSTNVAEPVCNFLLAYQDAVKAMYLYQSLWVYADNDPLVKQHTLGYKCEIIEEDKRRADVFEKMKKLHETYQRIERCEVENKLKKQIRFNNKRKNYE